MIGRVFGYAGVIGVSVFGGYLGWSVSDRDPPVRTVASEVLTPVVAPGGLLMIRYTVDRRQSCPVKVERYFIDAIGIRTVLEDVDFAVAGPLGQETYTTQVVVPTTAATGPARYRVIVSYKCNWLHGIWPLEPRLREYNFMIT